MGRTPWRVGWVLTFGLLALACGDSDDGNAVGSTTQPLSDFMLLDTNSTSALSGQDVSPRDYLQKVSGWYFTESS